MSSTLVLGGGGVTGIAWEIGVLLGLRDAGVDVTDAGTLIGTSAGSVVASLIATGVDLADAAASQGGSSREDDPPIAADMSLVMQAFAVLYDRSITPLEARARVGAMALAAPTGDDRAYVARFGRRFASRAWPTSPRLVITAVDAESGESVAWDAASDVPFVDAVAASCAVPCLFPPVTIGHRRYMDGGVRSHTNADLAAGASRVLVLSPMESVAPRWRKERAALGDARAIMVAPDDAALEAIGPDVMDSARRDSALAAGRAQGASMAGQVRAVYGPGA